MKNPARLSAVHRGIGSRLRQIRFVRGPDLVAAEVTAAVPAPFSWPPCLDKEWRRPGDGRVVAGYGTRSVIPWAWTSDEGIRAISESDGTATAANADGRFVVGQSWATGRSQAVLWNLEDGTERLLGSLRDDDWDTINSRASAVSDDGSIVVGTSWGRPFVWDEHHGMRRLEDVLSELGVAAEGWRLNTAVDISADGTRIAGTATNPNGQLEVFLIVIPEPTTSLLMSIGLVALAIRRGSTTGGSPGRSAAPRPL